MKQQKLTSINKQEFYNQNMEVFENDLDHIKANLDDASLEILVDMAKEGDLDPWDINLEKVTSKYLSAINQNPSDCLKEAGRAIFYASVLLRMKSDILAMQSSEALNIGIHKELDDDYLLEEELANNQIKQITFNDLEAAIRRKYIQKAKRFRKLTLKDLIQALQDAKDEEENRLYRKQQKLFDLDSYSIVAPEVGDDIMELTHAENLEAAIERLQIILPEHVLDGDKLEFESIVKMLGCWSNAFLAILFLAHEHQIEFKQDKFYGELWIHESESKRN
jgi:segregation and condensation protein A